MNNITHCIECEHCFESKRSKTGYYCEKWGYEDIACDTDPDGFCHRAKSKKDAVYIMSYAKRFPTASDALDVISRMKQICEYYGVATRADYLDLINEVPYHFSAHREGWLLDHIEKFKVIDAVDGGFFINVPRPVKID